jgi:hypothetical protein
MEALTPASPDSLPPLGDLIADEPFWRYPAGAASGITESTEHIWAALARRYGPSLVLLEHHPAPETGEGGETLDLVRVGADGSPRWTHVWPTPEENPRHGRARAVDGRLRVPDRQQAGERVRLVRG